MAKAAEPARSSIHDDSIFAEAMMKLTLSPLNSDESDTDLDVSAEEQQAERCSFKSERRTRTKDELALMSGREPPKQLSRSQTVYLDTCRESRLTEQGRVLNGLSLETLSLRNRYMGSKSLRPVSLAL
uniref:PKHG3 n=1 Tax=Macrostomum lignano TaxID=282301 RepID=A0A1I8HL34_9PLAT